MPLSGAPAAHDRHDLVAADVLRHERRARQIGSGLAAHRVAPVAEAALGREQRLAALHLLGRIRLRRRGLRRPLRCRALLRAASLSLTARRLPAGAASSSWRRSLRIQET